MQVGPRLGEQRKVHRKREGAARSWYARLLPQRFLWGGRSNARHKRLVCWLFLLLSKPLRQGRRFLQLLLPVRASSSWQSGQRFSILHHLVTRPVCRCLHLLLLLPGLGVLVQEKVSAVEALQGPDCGVVEQPLCDSFGHWGLGKGLGHLWCATLLVALLQWGL
jgi:hypothetical protein